MKENIADNSAICYIYITLASIIEVSEEIKQRHFIFIFLQPANYTYVARDLVSPGTSVWAGVV